MDRRDEPRNLRASTGDPPGTPPGTPPPRTPPEGGPGGGPGGGSRGGPRGCTFSRVFNNSPSRDRCWCASLTWLHRRKTGISGGGFPAPRAPRGPGPGTPPGGVPEPPFLTPLLDPLFDPPGGGVYDTPPMRVYRSAMPTHVRPNGLPSPPPIRRYADQRSVA